ncbi:Probable E3 ubiquitin-protein ligase HIP1 [Linum perenne]
MDDYSSKRGPDGLLVSRKGSSAVLRDTVNNKDRNGQFCTRIGCSGRMNSAKGTQLNISAKAQSSRTSVRSSSSGKEIIGSSSRTYPAVTNTRKSFPEPRKKSSSQVEPDSSESASTQDEPDVPEPEYPSRKLHKGNHSSSAATAKPEVASTQVGSSRLASRTGSHGDFNQKSILGNQHNLASSSTYLSSKSTVQGRRTNVSRNGMRNFKCNSVSDVVSSSSTSSDSNITKKDAVKKRVSIGESSTAAKGKRMTGSAPLGQISTPNYGVSISDSRARSGPPIRDNPVSSVRTRRSLNSYNYNRIQGTRNNMSVSETLAVVSQVPQHDLGTDLSSSTSSQHFFMEPSTGNPSYSRPGSSSESSQGIRPSSPAEISNMRSLLNRENFRRYNMDGIAEVLLALERIEQQDEELTYEQLLVLETNLFLSGLNFHDQHRDMRLDIDNMSYEELLALEDRMGTVSTAVKEDELSECLKTGIYQSVLTEGGSGKSSSDMEDMKCSICQEEYEDEEELGRLRCEHKYHLRCIQQWLRVKNWCPVCKASAVIDGVASSHSDSS